MMDQLLEWDKDLLLYLNSLHVPWLDPVMLFLTKTFIWLPLYILLLFLVIREYKKDSWMILLGISFTILLTDQITSGFMKPYFARLRPSQEPELRNLLHLVNGYMGGKFGFASSHAANTFGTASFFWLLFRHTKKWIIWLFLWAALMTYTRIYLGVHYPSDVIVGGLIGVVCGWVGFKLSLAVRRALERRREIQP
ncbi:MAG: phosphatase PAP2 family protein [Cyclobacteriaceae bacterium]|nr:phosphatase PAP2 family protein [Cyclobacteriaceae bacterium]